MEEEFYKAYEEFNKFSKENLHHYENRKKLETKFVPQFLVSQMKRIEGKPIVQEKEIEKDPCDIKEDNAEMRIMAKVKNLEIWLPAPTCTIISTTQHDLIRKKTRSVRWKHKAKKSIALLNELSDLKYRNVEFAC